MRRVSILILLLMVVSMADADKRPRDLLGGGGSNYSTKKDGSWWVAMV